LLVFLGRWGKIRFLNKCLEWSAGRLVRVFDPEHPEKSLVLKEGRVVEVTDLDVEQEEPGN